MHYNEFEKIIADTKTVLDLLSDNAAFSLALDTHYTVVLHSNINLLSSIKTLENILFCYKNYSFSDAYVLLRKYRDDIFQYLYFLKISIESKRFLFKSNELPHKLKKRVEVVHLWSKNDFIKNPNHMLKSFIRAVEYKDFLQSDTEIKRCCKSFFNCVWEEIDKTSNDYVHGNGSSCIIDNFSDLFQSNQKCMDDLSKKIKLISIYFLSLLLLMKSHLFMSSDYVDALECNLQPIDGSQYYIASAFQEYFDKYVYELSPELLEYLRLNNSHGMKIN